MAADLRVVQPAHSVASGFERAHPGTQGADNIIEVQSTRYSAEMGSTPLIIRGPGAGAHVTAGGVFGDLCKLGAQLGASVRI
jgi:aspartokinase/homoserine dehydrogenase 1